MLPAKRPSLTAEAGHAGTVEAFDVNAHVNGCLNVMRYLGILPRVAPAIERPVWIERTAGITSDQTGIFCPPVKRGTYVEKGMLVGCVTDHVGRTILEARAPEAGVVLYLRALPSMTRGETIASIGGGQTRVAIRAGTPRP